MKELNRIKKKIDWMLKTFNLLCKALRISIHQVLQQSENPVIKTGLQITDEVTSNVKDHKHFHHKEYGNKDRYRNLIRNPIEFMLYVYSFDSAWRDIGTYFLWRLKEELKTNKELCNWLDNEVKKPDFWYYNVWEDAQQKTRDMVNKGELLDKQMSPSEHIFVDESQAAYTEQVYKNKKKQFDKHHHW
jgi:hypothetical protein